MKLELTEKQVRRLVMVLEDYVELTYNFISDDDDIAVIINSLTDLLEQG